MIRKLDRDVDALQLEIEDRDDRINTLNEETPIVHIVPSLYPLPSLFPRPILCPIR